MRKPGLGQEEQNTFASVVLRAALYQRGVIVQVPLPVSVLQAMLKLCERGCLSTDNSAGEENDK